MKRTKMIKKNYEFRAILNKGKYVTGKFIECFYVSNKQDINFMGIAISSKLAKANKRNRIKRLIRENYQKIENDIKVGKSFVFLFKKNRDVRECTYKNIEEDMLKIMKEMKMLTDE